MSNDAAPQKPTSRNAWFARFGLGIIILAILLWWQGAPIISTFTGVPWWTILAAVASYWILQLLCAWKWQLLLNSALRESDSAAAPLSLFSCARFYLAGMFWNLWMPSSIGGDAARAYMAGKECGRLSLAASAVFMDRLSGLIALLIIGACAVLAGNFNGISQESNALGQSAHLLWLAGLLLAVLLIILIAGRFFSSRLAASENAVIARVASKIESLHRSLDLYRKPGTRPVLIIAFLLSVLFQLGLIGLNTGLALVVHLPLSFFVYWWLVPALALASLLPVGIGGLGVREAAAVALVGSLVTAAGGQMADLIAWSLLWQATLWLAGLPGAWSGVTVKKGIE
jgi:uncharacterized protein (TIRG00374 family)